MNPARRYLLDTNIVSDLARHPDGVVAKRIAEVGAERIAISLIVACEIRFGLAKSTSAKLKQNVEAILAHLEILPLESPLEEHYADIRAALEAAGTPIGPNDLLIAAHAKALGMTLVTHNMSEFERVPGLVVENWLASEV
jgi:tRNA(fMet)-specific endonuclease VapC